MRQSQQLTGAFRSSITSLRPRAGPVSVAAWATPYASLRSTLAGAGSSRRYAATASTSPSSFPAGSPPPSQPQPKPRSATSEFYRALVPAMLHCLALGSIVYYALEFGYIYLAREKEGDELRGRVEQLETELALARAHPGAADSLEEAGGELKQKKWWSLW